MSAGDFKQWLLQTGKSVRSAQSYSGAINGSISQWAKDAGLIQSNLSDIESSIQFVAVSVKIQQQPIFQQRNATGNNMYGSAIKLYLRYLEDVTGQAITDDIDQILGDNRIPVTEKSTLISTRIGQGQFRKSLIEYWKGCSVTQHQNTRILIASHIKPWSKSEQAERLDPFNGLLLLPNLDKVFDLGYITFDVSGKIKISAQLENAAGLGIQPDMIVNLTVRHHEFMAYHRDVQFENALMGYV